MNKRFLFFVSAMMMAAAFWAQARLQEQSWHASSAGYLKYNADGKYLLSASEVDAKIWDVSSGKLIRSYSIRKNSECDLSPDGKSFVYVSQDGTFRRSYVENTMEVIHRFPNGIFDFCNVSYAPNGKYYSIEYTYHDFTIYDAATGKALYNWTVKKGSSEKSAFASSPGSDLSYFIRVADEGSQTSVTAYTLFGKDAGKSVHYKKLGQGRLNVQGIKVSPGNKYLAIWDLDGNVWLEAYLGGWSKTMKIEKGSKLDFISDKQLVTFQRDEVKKWDLLPESSSPPKLISTAKNKAYSYSFAVSPDKSSYAACNYSEIKFLSFADNKVLGRAGLEMPRNEFCYYPSSDKLFFSAKGNVSFFDMRLQKTYQSESLAEGWNFLVGSAMAEGGLYYASFKSGSKKTQFFFYDHKDGKEKEVYLHNKEYDDLRLCARAGANFFAFKDEKSGTAYICDSATKKIAKSFKLPKDEYDDYSDLVGSLDGRFFASTGYGCDSLVYDTQRKKLVTVKGERLVFSPNGKLLSVRDDRSDDISCVVYDTESWKAVKSFPDAYRPLCFSCDGNLFAAAGLKDLFVYDIKSGSLIKKFLCNADEAVFSGDGSKLFAKTIFNPGIDVYSVQTGRLLARLMVDEDGEWVASVPEGFFSGTEKGASKFVHMVDGMKVSELDQYAQVLYRPDMVAAKMEGYDLSKLGKGVDLSDLTASGEPPLITMEALPSKTGKRDVDVTFFVQERGGGIGKVYVSLNGKPILLQDRARKIGLVSENNLSVEKKNSGGMTAYRHTLTLSNGENVIEAYATNSSGFIESLHAKSHIKWEGSLSKPNLYVLCIGVNQYQDESLRLKYAVPDASAIADAFSKKGGSLYQSVNVYSLLDEKANKSDIEKTFKGLSEKIRPDDVFVFYLSGHGTQDDGDYYYIPQDFRNIGSLAVSQGAISKQFLLDNFYSIKAGKSLIMLDTCASGSFISGGYSSPDGGAARLSKDSGQAIISAATSEQYAMEGYEGHGIFTYVVLAALEGKADRDKDGFVTLRELCDYIEDTVPELSYNKWAYRQIPWIDRRKQNFPLVGK